MYNQIPYSFYNPGNYATLGLNPTTGGIAGLAKKNMEFDYTSLSLLKILYVFFKKKFYFLL